MRAVEAVAGEQTVGRAPEQDPRRRRGQVARIGQRRVRAAHTENGNQVPCVPGEVSGAAWAVVSRELQELAGLAGLRGGRGLDRRLAQLDAALEQCLDAGRGDSINRVTGSGEFIAVLGSDHAGETLAALQAVADEASSRLPRPLLLGAAGGGSGESTNAVFLRADRELSARKDALR